MANSTTKPDSDVPHATATALVAAATTAISPLHPSIIPRLDPEYAAYYNQHLAHKPGLHEIPWTPDLRLEPPQPGGSVPLTVGSVRDFGVGKFKVRVFTPEGERPKGGWPGMVYFHGGGWTLGNIDTENQFSSHVCKHARTVVVSVDYRLAPENPYPAAVEDAWEALLWTRANAENELGIDLSRLTVGGSSSGGNLAAILTHKAALAHPPIPLVFQLLIVPVIDNTANSQNPIYASWSENAHAPSLTPAKMMWYQGMYLPDTSKRAEWEASPIFAPDAGFEGSPNGWIAVCELDVLRDEGVAYGEKLRKFGKSVEVKVYKSAPHPVMAMDGVLQVGRDLISDACVALAAALGTNTESIS
ncbi:hypothetical protein BOTBODRAFT_30666 [Botryobasidium botryosum FD-172 SS1]|uniref:Alpha/beta hydrolase fold-3 domain-containing protein n=1 Tax=Botryobasidium botryosum (strain FD-172 SS1) TaxID=930990 RepID=A0A067MLX7_BOTB1|nr:hypothetical protein BOTBODRAFT_30666 [Botryobasidium botryosum FD-172 SS1]